MAQSEPEADADRTFAVLHQFAGDIVDRRDVVRVHGVAQAKSICEERGSHQQRLIPEDQHSPDPGRQIANDQHRVNADQRAPEAARPVTANELLNEGHAVHRCASPPPLWPGPAA